MRQGMMPAAVFAAIGLVAYFTFLHGLRDAEQTRPALTPEVSGTAPGIQPTDRTDAVQSAPERAHNPTPSSAPSGAGEPSRHAARPGAQAPAAGVVATGRASEPAAPIRPDTEPSGAADARVAAPAAAGAFDLVGTWELAGADGALARYRFAADGTVTTLTRTPNGWQETAGSTFLYRLDDPSAPTVIEFLRPNESTPSGSVRIGSRNAGTFTTVDDPESGPTRWVRVTP